MSSEVIRLHRPQGLEVELCTLGAAWLGCHVPMPDGSRRNVVLGCPTLAQQAAQRAYLGATVGRFANRIREARYRRGGREVRLAPNAGSPHQLHGGDGGFHARTWTLEACDDTCVVMSLVSADGDQGYPGELQVRVTYALVEPMALEVRFEATTTAETPVSLSQHAYFNLDGDALDIRHHRLRIAAQHYLPVDRDLLPLGWLAPVAHTSYDFRTPKPIGQDWLADAGQVAGRGYDHAFLLEPHCAAAAEPAVELTSADGALSMTLATSLPALQFYGGQLLRDIPSRHGGVYGPCAGVALEPQFLPDSPNHPEWPQPSCWLRPGEVWRHLIRYRFGVR
ncbi:galactose-1-epimerase [Caldimonas thermodepolymerans]|uniref:Aldose 1-epimerase n=1 Tax=Caldimonas thermodepolymerans TaxID=215580 RepID=A0A2S5T389_9BURK|nr:galactose-1-epimerase [Caldimonas thermodepolymerans]PPE69450.1 galactose-1-epimerase [Caldimonas thermodepolymerans]QPC32800.1 galactose-1-epimerase [Caldimonas thermodepolymerans]RDI03569.1 aldose 1-epimerase [Caldimonas thermodepolymerans]UZG45666.1 galactose-1-epimerase [Caldimonas thermodepolymerans]